MKYKYRTSFTYNGKRYEVYANSAEELYTKKALRKKELQDNIIIYDNRISVDIWAEKAFDTYKHDSSGLEDTKARYRKYVSPYIGIKPIGSIKSVECQTIRAVCFSYAGSHFHKRLTHNWLRSAAWNNPARQPRGSNTTEGSRKGVFGMMVVKEMAGGRYNRPLAAQV